MADALEPRLFLSAATPATIATLAAQSYTNVVQDSAGDIFGTFSSTTDDSAGSIFEIPAGSTNTVTVASFGQEGTDNELGEEPVGNLLIDVKGKLGTVTYFGETRDGETRETRDSHLFWKLGKLGTVTYF